MILLVNGGVFLFMAASAWGVAEVTGGCDDNGDPAGQDCDPGASIAGPMRNVAAGLVVVGILLLVLGAFLKRRRPPQT